MGVDKGISLSALACLSAFVCSRTLCMYVPISNVGSDLLLAGATGTESQQPCVCWPGTGQPLLDPESHCVQLLLKQGIASHGTCVLFK